MNRTLFFFIFLTSFIALAFNACSGFESSVGEIEVSSSGVKLEAFNKTLAPMFSNNCGTCHIKTNAPFFISEDVELSLEETLGMINIEFIDESPVLRKVASNHFCWVEGDNTTCDQSVAEMKKVVVAFLEESGLASVNKDDGRIKLNEVVIPAEISVPEGKDLDKFPTKELEFPLDALGADFVGAKFLLDITWFSGSYEISKPRLANLSKHIEVKDIRFAIDGVIRKNETSYSAIDNKIELKDFFFDKRSMILTAGKGGPGIDKISPTFAVLNSLNNSSREVPKIAEVSAIMTVNCVYCHVPKPVFNQYGNIVKLSGGVPVAGGLVSPRDLNSRLYQSLLVRAGKNTMPKGKPALSTAEKDVVKNWILAGAKNDEADNGAVKGVKHFTPVFNILKKHCIDCHLMRNRFDSPRNIVTGFHNGRPSVVPGNLNSPIYKSLFAVGNDIKNRMPLDRPPLSDKDKNTIRDWILGGAKDK